MRRRTLRQRVFEVLERPTRGDRLGWNLGIVLIALIVASVLAAALETVPTLFARHMRAFHLFDVFITLVFGVEFLARLWCAPEGQPELTAAQARLRYLRSPMAIVDIVAIAPMMLTLLWPIDFQLARALRLIRIYKLTRYSPALTELVEVIREEADTLFAAFSILGVMLVFAATGAYMIEHKAQPEVFGSVPAAMWWAIVTLTTVGYGDVVPVTPLGRVFGGVITLIGVGMAALPAGIISNGLANHLRTRREILRVEFRRALENGQIGLGEGRRIEVMRRRLGLSAAEAHRIYNDVKAQGPRHCQCPECGATFDVKGE